MKFALFTIASLSALVSQVDAALTWGCGGPGSFTAAGSTTVAPITNLSAIQYVTICKNNTITVNVGGSGNGAKRVCADPTASGGAGPVEIGNLSRDWKSSEANTTDGVKYTCILNYPARSVIKQPVALDGISIVVERLSSVKAFADCLTALNNGITSKMLRWIYSNLTTLEDDKSYAPNNDGNAATRKWSELNAGCPAVEIKPAAPSAIYGTNTFFTEVIFTSAGEGFRSAVTYFQDNSPQLRDYVLNVDYSIGFFGFSFYSQFIGPLLALGIDGTAPDKTSIATDKYVPLGRRIFSNYYTDADALAKTKCFNDFHYTEAGRLVIISTNFIPIPDGEWDTVRAQVPGTCVQPGAAPTKKPCVRKCTFFIFFCKCK